MMHNKTNAIFKVRKAMAPEEQNGHVSSVAEIDEKEEGGFQEISIDTREIKNI
jgi:hypothetical protein